MQAVGEKILGAVGEAVFGFARDRARVQQEGEIAVEGDLSEADDDTDARQRLDFSGEMSTTVANLLGEWLVTGRGAANDGGDPCVTELQAIFAGDGAGFGGEAEFVQAGVHDAAGAVTGQGTAGAVGAVGSGGEAEDEAPASAVAEA